MKNLPISYISDFKIPSKKAQAIHILKMVDKFCKYSNDVYLVANYYDKEISKKKLSKNYLLKNIQKLKIFGVFEKIKSDNFINRILFGFFGFLKIRQRKGLIITRSYFVSFFLILNKKKHFLEIHQEPSGLSKIFFKNFKLIKSRYIIKIIVISQAFKKILSNQNISSVVLPDGSDPEDFKKKKLKNKIKNIYYFGSFYRGRGIELIIDISKKMKNKIFYLYGNKNNFKIDSTKNMKIFNFINYSKLTKEIKKADLLLMPYSLKSVSVGSYKNDDTSKVASPLKMFEYLSTGIPILSSNLPVLREVLIDKHNCLIVKNNNLNEWIKNINIIDKNFMLRKKIKKNAIKTAKKYSWDSRVEKYLKEYLKFKNYSKI